MIPKDRPVTGHDLEDLREKLALSVTDLCWLFGLSMPNWGKIKKAGPEPVKDPAVALLARFLDSYPEACPIPRPPEPGDVAERLPELSRKTLGIALGPVEPFIGYEVRTIGSQYLGTAAGGLRVWFYMLGPSAEQEY